MGVKPSNSHLVPHLVGNSTGWLLCPTLRRARDGCMKGQVKVGLSRREPGHTGVFREPGCPAAMELCGLGEESWPLWTSVQHTCHPLVLLRNSWEVTWLKGLWEVLKGDGGGDDDTVVIMLWSQSYWVPTGFHEPGSALFLRFFWCGLFLKSLLSLLQYCFCCFGFWVLES